MVKSFWCLQRSKYSIYTYFSFFTAGLLANLTEKKEIFKPVYQNFHFFVVSFPDFLEKIAFSKIVGTVP